MERWFPRLRQITPPNELIPEVPPPLIRVHFAFIRGQYLFQDPLEIVANETVFQLTRNWASRLYFASRECTAIHKRQRSRFHGVYRAHYISCFRLDNLPAVRGHANQRQFPTRHVLLELERFIRRQQNIES